MGYYVFTLDVYVSFCPSVCCAQMSNGNKLICFKIFFDSLKVTKYLIRKRLYWYGLNIKET